MDQIFTLFLQYADSFKLTRAIEKKCLSTILTLLASNNPKKWPDSQRQLRALSRLLAFCRYRLDGSQTGQQQQEEEVEGEEEDLVVFSWIRGAVEGRWMLNLLPLLYEYFNVIGGEGIKRR